jgi:hypothetical protein
MTSGVYVHVICCNDSVEFAVIGSLERAERKKEELARKDFGGSPSFDEDYERYKKRLFWHIHTVVGEMG